MTEGVLHFAEKEGLEAGAVRVLKAKGEDDTASSEMTVTNVNRLTNPATRPAIDLRTWSRGSWATRRD